MDLHIYVVQRKDLVHFLMTKKSGQGVSKIKNRTRQLKRLPGEYSTNFGERVRVDVSEGGCLFLAYAYKDIIALGGFGNVL
mmetsp:Transcript_28433/g.39569  ORF Transcript_28433/g.39569 Transcript_28433/m.39569 type:complete len:81 (+) Transcript_28433:454-696(+)